MSTSIQKGDHPFTTTDAELASALYTAGCSPADGAQDGPAINLYSPDICRDRWRTVRNAQTGEPNRIPLLTHKPVSPEEFERAALLAEKLKIPGIVTYAIKRDSTFTEAITAHDKMAEEFEIAKRDERTPIIPNLSTLTETALIMVVCYIRRKNAQDMKAMTWARSPRCALGEMQKEVIPIEGASTELLEQRSYTATSAGAAKLWDLHLSEEKRATKMLNGERFLHPKPTL